MGVPRKPLALPGAFLLEPRVLEDTRGGFFESWREDAYEQAGALEPFVQDNLSYSRKNVLRGLHFQTGRAQGQLVTLVLGRVCDMLVDLRRGSPAFCRHETILLEEGGARQVYMPPGVAHGFCVLSETAILHYKCTQYYSATIERGVVWNDPALAIEWPLSNPIVSPRDAAYPTLERIPEQELPLYRE